MPLAEIFVLCGFYMIYIVEELTHACLDKCHDSGEKVNKISRPFNTYSKLTNATLCRRKLAPPPRQKKPRPFLEEEEATPTPRPTCQRPTHPSRYLITA